MLILGLEVQYHLNLDIIIVFQFLAIRSRTTPLSLKQLLLCLIKLYKMSK